MPLSIKRLATAGQEGAAAAAGGAGGDCPPPSPMTMLAAGWRSRFHPRPPEASRGFIKDMRNTNKAFQQRAEPS